MGKGRRCGWVGGCAKVRRLVVEGVNVDNAFRGVLDSGRGRDEEGRIGEGVAGGLVLVIDARLDGWRGSSWGRVTTRRRVSSFSIGISLAVVSATTSP